MIEVKNVTKKYGNFVAVDNISFNIKEGEIIGLLGPNGAGKSTTMNMITGFIEQTEGEIIIDGYDMLKKPKKAKKEIGYMPEGVPLYTDLTVKEFVSYKAQIKKVDRKIRKEQIEKTIYKVAIYIRLSKEDVDRGYDESESIKNQRTLLTEYVQKLGWEYQLIHTYDDQGITGTKFNRPDFQRMIRDIENPISYGDECDKECWMQLLEILIKEKKTDDYK